MIQPLTVEMLGGLRVRRGEEEITRFRTQKTGALLAYLALRLRHRHAREELIELLWPDSDLESGRMSLRTALASLRRQLEPPGTPENSVLVADRACVHLHTGVVGTDVDRIDTAARAAPKLEDPAARAALLAEAVDLYRGPLLPGFYEEWALQERERIQAQVVGMLRDLVAALEQAGEPQRAIPYAQRVVGLEPLLEEGHADLMRLYAATGRAATATRQYRELERLLREELGVAPSAAVRALHERLQKEGARPQAVEAPAAPVPVAAPPPPVPAPPEAPPPVAPHLPVQLTRFFGRESEIARLEQLLTPPAPTRLVTLTGPGGSGKTRLALEAARRLAEAYRGAVWHVPLADITDSVLLPGAISHALHLPPAPDREPLDRLAEVLAQRPSLLILDNFEQMDDGGPAVVRNLLEQAPALACLVTSRQHLGLGGEQEFPVPPLPIPAMPDTPERLTAFPSVRLFLDRACAARPDFQVTRENAAAVAALCERLEGLPLALELAAAWAQTLTPAQMLARLSQRFDLLTSRRRDLTPRHRSLRAAVEWSYRLLPAPLQRLFARLSLFRGGWLLDTAEAVCGGLEDGASLSMLEALAELRDRSLILAEEAGEEMRYRLLETLRDYAEEQLAPEERQTLEARHLACFTRMAEEAEIGLRGAEQEQWQVRLEREHDNMRAALDRCQQRGEAAAGLRLAGALTAFWESGGYAAEGARRLEELLAQAPEAPAPLRAKALLGTAILRQFHQSGEAVLALYEESLRLYRELGDKSGAALALRRMHNPVYFMRRDPGPATVLLEESLALCREVGDMTGIAETLTCMANLVRDTGDYTLATSLYEQSLALYRKIGNRYGVSMALADMGYMLHAQEELERAQSVLEESLALCRQIHNRVAIAHVLWLLGRLAQGRQDYPAATAYLEEGAAIARETGARQQVINCLVNLGMVDGLQGEHARALRRYEESLALNREMGNRAGQLFPLGLAAQTALRLGDSGLARRFLREYLRIAQEGGFHRATIFSLEGLAVVSAHDGAPERAARLFGVTEAAREALVDPPARYEAEEYARSVAVVRAALGEAAYRQAWEAGSRLSVEEAAVGALAGEEGECGPDC